MKAKRRYRIAQRSNQETQVTGGDMTLKKWECVQVKSHKDVGETIEKWQKNGWRLHAYQTAGMGAGPMSYTVNHYLLFERESE